MKQKILGLSTFALVMLITGAIDSIRNLPATALFGSALIFFFILSAILFLIPAALVSAELASSWTEKSGIFHWTHLAFGEKTAFLAIWLQWINTMVWFPTILSFIAGTIAYLIDPQLAQNKLYLVSSILCIFWLLTFINLKGIHFSSKFINFCALTGTYIPVALILILAAIWSITGHPSQIHFNSENVLPSLHHSNNWISLTAIMSIFLGLELATVHVKAVRNPQKTFPRALFFSTLFILIPMLGGSLAIALVLPAKDINLVNGVMQAFTNFLSVYHLKWLIPVMAVALVIGNLGGIMSWVISPAKGLLQAAELNYLPRYFQHENKHGAPSRILVAQGFIVSFVCLAFLLMPSINGSYWLLSDLSTQLYMLMYVLMFSAAFVLRFKHATHPRGFKIPGGAFGIALVSLLGLCGTAITLIVGFFPPDGINVGGFLHYEIVFISGMLGMILPALFFYYYKRFAFKKLQLTASLEKNMST